MKPIRVELELGGRTLRWETGYLAKQAAGSTLCTINETTAFAAVCTADPRPGIDFFPLSVDYREKTQAAGKFPGGFIKREGRPTNKEILTCRLIDRPVRPMFPKSYNDEVQICAFVVQVDRVNDPDIAAMNASFAALHTADLPFIGPLGAVRVGRVDGRLVMNPDFEQRKVSDLEVIVAGSRDAITMVEGTCAEISEDDFLDVLDFAHDGVRKICGAMDELRRKCGKSFSEWEEPEVSVHPVIADVRGAYRSRLVDALLTDGKFERSAAVKALRAEAMEEFAGDDDDDAEERAMAIKKSWHDFEADVTREMLVKGQRVDGRRTDEVRDIHISAGWQSRVHGSSVFTRGETQA
ncbi:MAG: hypothetical protein KDB18_09520, partial [Salinibacterium sp.]|nr:hypothetical protein [Salinibacterium sp.]